MGNIDKAVEVFQTLEKRYEESELQAAQDGMNVIDVGYHAMKNMKIPIKTDNEHVKEYVKEFQLDKPENLIRFFVEASSEAMKSLQVSMNGVAEQDLVNIVSDVKIAKCKMIDARNNPKTEREELFAAKDKLDNVILTLPEKIELYISSIKKIDTKSKWKFFLGSTEATLEQIDTNVECAKVALTYLIEAIEEQRDLTAFRRIKDPSYNEPSSVKQGIEQIQRIILEGDTCSLMHAYDKDKENEFWLKEVDNMVGRIIDKKRLIEYVDEYDDIDFS